MIQKGCCSAISRALKGGWAPYLGGRWGLAFRFDGGFFGRHGQLTALMDDSRCRGKLPQIDCALAEGMLLMLP